MADLPIDHVETFANPDVAGAGAALSDGDPATYVTVGSSTAADWFVHYDGTLLAGVDAFTLTIDLDVISRSASEPFGIRVHLSDPDRNYELQGTIEVLPDGPSTITQTVDAAFVASPPPEWMVFDFGEHTFEALRDGIGTTPVLHVEGWNGIPYVVHMSQAQITVGGVTPPTVLPVTRQYPRDDSLGSMGSAPRMFPPPRSGRIVGGHT